MVEVRVSAGTQLRGLSPQRFRSCVYRRYNDFVVFQEALLHKFPYRMVPGLPPKRMLGGKAGCAGPWVAGRAAASKAASCAQPLRARSLQQVGSRGPSRGYPNPGVFQ